VDNTKQYKKCEEQGRHVLYVSSILFGLGTRCCGTSRRRRTLTECPSSELAQEGIKTLILGLFLAPSHGFDNPPPKKKNHAI
jgi:hypothetical protein